MSAVLDVEMDWDPEPHNRAWYRHYADGQLGWLVRRDGKDLIRLDRASEELLRPMNSEWIPENEHRPLTRMQVAQICFEADRRLSFFSGLPENLKKDWLSLSDNKRIAWVEDGPSGELRHKLWAAIQGVLKEYSK